MKNMVFLPEQTDNFDESVYDGLIRVMHNYLDIFGGRSIIWLDNEWDELLNETESAENNFRLADSTLAGL